jgi:hypothetical protein
VNWGTGVGGLRLQIAVRGILSVGDEARYTVNWRPQLLCFTKPCSLWTKEQHAGHKLLSFASQLKKVFSISHTSDKFLRSGQNSWTLSQ